ncbi:hypothetical protein ONZ43_g5908 [Nemania bipapillata]|uniref:Uncharacterized protein n=1 Tax=Nemania bipapillata TaxID=110536 RepID=A0ACC2I5T7_9PEZI|nr:hypothetical protein ONZ43_g5908 [Nemania bipapillata]
MRVPFPLRIGTPMQPGHAVEIESSPLFALARRQLVERDDGDDIWFWYTSTGIIIKYAIFFGILFLIALWVVGGRVHAKRRLGRGQKPLGYHAWLLSRAERAQVDPAYAYAAQNPVYRPVYGAPNGGDYYGMHPMPPPVYDPARPPVYDGPPAGSKIDPVQDRQAQAQTQGQTEGVTPEYAPPAGPPPGR